MLVGWSLGRQKFLVTSFLDVILVGSYKIPRIYTFLWENRLPLNFLGPIFWSFSPVERAGRVKNWSLIKIKNEIRFVHTGQFLGQNFWYLIIFSGKLKKSIFWPFLTIFPSLAPWELENWAGADFTINVWISLKI